MSSEEFLYRSKAVVGRWREEGRWKLGLHTDYGICLSRLDVQQGAFSKLWQGSSDYTVIVRELRSKHPVYVRGIREAADTICDREFRLLGIPVRYPSRISWTADPLSRKDWPMLFYARIKIFEGDSESGDVKYVWELNRHQFLITLGKAYRLSGDDRYALAAVELMQDWIEANPYNIGINWTSALEVAIRSLSWCQVCELIHDSAAFSSDKRQNILRSLYQHGHYIEKHLSFFFSPYNHLIGEATALFLVGNLLSWLKPARRWRHKGWAILEQEMPKQFHADGGTVEQATGYHHFTLGFYLQAVLLRRRLGLAIPFTVWSLLEKAFEFSMYMMRPDGLVPMIGDGDEGRAIDIAQNSIWDFRYLLAIGAVLFQRGDFKKISGPFPSDVSWLLGTEGWNSYQALPEEEPKEKSKALPESGYFTMRTGWDEEAHYLSFDCGPIADAVRNNDIPSAAHGHADALSIEISAFGIPILIDPGLYTYNGDEKWHRYFRETAAHNTVVVDRQSQAEYRGRLKWSHGPEPTLHQWMTSTCFDYVEGAHNGYARLSQPVFHRRSVAFVKPDYWLVRDEVYGEGHHQIDRFFHFAPMKVSIDPETKIAVAECQEGCRLAVSPVETRGVTVEALDGGQEPESGWLATGYGKKVSAPVVRYGTAARVPITLHTLLIPFRGERPKMKVTTLSIATADCAGERCVIIQLKGKTDILLFSSGEKTVEFHKGWKTNGRIACLRLDERGHVISCAVLDGSLIENSGGFWLRASARIPFVALCLENDQATIEMPEPAEFSTSLPKYRVIIAKDQPISASQSQP